MSSFDGAWSCSLAREMTRGMRMATAAVLLMNIEMGPTMSITVRSCWTSPPLESASTRLAEINDERTVRGQVALTHGIALHVGTVQFGNIGTLQRLDFTVVGPEVNLTSRISGLCGLLGEEILCSEAVGQMIDTPLRSLGIHSLKGISEPVEVFAPLAK